MERTSTDKRVTVVLPAELHQQLKLLAVTTNSTIQDLYLEAIRELLKRTGYSDTAG